MAERSGVGFSHSSSSAVSPRFRVPPYLLEADAVLAVIGVASVVWPNDDDDDAPAEACCNA